MKTYLLGFALVGTFTPQALGQSFLEQGPNGNFYQIVLAPRIAWDDAKMAAELAVHEGFPGHLVTILSVEEDAFVLTLARTVSDDLQLWIGGSQIRDQPTPRTGWEWVNEDGALAGTNDGPEYANWLQDFGGEPNDCCGTPVEDNEENHAALFFAGERWGWNDVHSLDDIAGYIVEYNATSSRFSRGDVNADGTTDISDPIFTLDYLFGPGAIDCLDAADANDDGALDISDPIGLLGFIFQGTSPPELPWGECGVDPGADALTCNSYPPCDE
jgi:hypothetical protein